MRRSEGFILLEVMLAGAVLAGAVLVGVQSIRSSLRMTRFNEEFYRASLLLERGVGEREKGGGREPESLEDPVIGPFSWHMEKILETEPDANWHVEHYTLSWGEGAHAQHLELSTPIQD